MKKLLVLATAVFLVTGVAFAHEGDGKKCGKEKGGKECCKKEGKEKSCCKKDKAGKKAKAASATEAPAAEEKKM